MRYSGDLGEIKSMSSVRYAMVIPYEIVDDDIDIDMELYIGPYQWYLELYRKRRVKYLKRKAKVSF